MICYDYFYILVYIMKIYSIKWRLITGWTVFQLTSGMVLLAVFALIYELKPDHFCSSVSKIFEFLI